MSDNEPGVGVSDSHPVPPEITAMGSCLPAMVFQRRFATEMGIVGLPPRIGGVNRSEYLVNHGYELAWASGRFETIEQFANVMRRWHRWAAGYLIFEVAMLALMLVEAIAWYGHHWWHR